MKIPFSLSVYEHAARFIGRRPWDVSRDTELLVDAHTQACGFYGLTQIIVGIDIYNIEAEAYGCSVVEPPDNGIPAITDHPFETVAEVCEIAPYNPATDGRWPMLLDAAVQLRDTLPGVEIRIPLSGPFSIAQSLLGLNTLLMATCLEPDTVRNALQRLADTQVACSRFIKEAGLDVAFFESAAAPPLLSPDQFRDIELPPLKTAIQGVSDVVQHSVPCIIGGDTAPIIPSMLETGTGFLICPAETDRRTFLAAMEPYPEVTVRVNLSPGTYTSGTREEIVAEIDDVLELAQGKPNILLGTGAIPYETDPENIRFIQEYASS